MKTQQRPQASGVLVLPHVTPKTLSAALHLTVVSRGRKGKRLPYPAKGIRRRSLRPYGGAAVIVRGVKTVIVQRLSVHGYDPIVHRSERLCVVIERVHLDHYPRNPQTETNGRMKGA